MTLIRSTLVRWAVGSLALTVVGLALVVRVPDMDHHVPGRVGGFGWKMDGSECYMNVSYTVDGQKFRITSSRDKRWCGYGGLHMIGKQYIPVYFEPATPEDGTLTPRGPWPMRSIALGGLGLLGCLVAARRRARGQRQSVGDQSGQTCR